MERIYSIGQVAKLFRVAPRTAAKWFDNGELQGFRIPGRSRPRRVTHTSLVDLSKRLGIYLEFEELGGFLIISATMSKADFIESMSDDRDNVNIVRYWSDLGYRLKGSKWRGILIDIARGRDEAQYIVRQIKLVYPECHTGVILTEDRTDATEVEFWIGLGAKKVFIPHPSPTSISDWFKELYVVRRDMPGMVGDVIE